MIKKGWDSVGHSSGLASVPRVPFIAVTWLIDRKDIRPVKEVYVLGDPTHNGMVEIRCNFSTRFNKLLITVLELVINTH